MHYPTIQSSFLTERKFVFQNQLHFQPPGQGWETGGWGGQVDDRLKVLHSPLGFQPFNPEDRDGEESVIYVASTTRSNTGATSPALQWTCCATLGKSLRPYVLPFPYCMT